MFVVRFQSAIPLVYRSYRSAAGHFSRSIVNSPSHIDSFYNGVDLVSRVELSLEILNFDDFTQRLSKYQEIVLIIGETDISIFIQIIALPWIIAILILGAKLWKMGQCFSC
jgi:hypothetical protein